jgi:hypothetical protein
LSQPMPTPAPKTKTSASASSIRTRHAARSINEPRPGRLVRCDAGIGAKCRAASSPSQCELSVIRTVKIRDYLINASKFGILDQRLGNTR